MNNDLAATQPQDQADCIPVVVDGHPGCANKRSTLIALNNGVLIIKVDAPHGLALAEQLAKSGLEIDGFKKKF